MGEYLQFTSRGSQKIQNWGPPNNLNSGAGGDKNPLIWCHIVLAFEVRGCKKKTQKSWVKGFKVFSSLPFSQCFGCNRIALGVSHYKTDYSNM